MFEKVSAASEKILKEFYKHSDDLYWKNRIRQIEGSSAYDDLWDCIYELRAAGLVRFDEDDDIILNVRTTAKGKTYFSDKKKSIATIFIDKATDKLPF